MLLPLPASHPAAEETGVRAIALFDHEEVGSDSAQVGATRLPYSRQPTASIPPAAQRGMAGWLLPAPWSPLLVCMHRNAACLPGWLACGV